MIVHAKRSVNKILVKPDIHVETPGNPGVSQYRIALFILVLPFVIKPEEGVVFVLSPGSGLTEFVKTVRLGRRFAFTLHPAFRTGLITWCGERRAVFPAE